MIKKAFLVVIVVAAGLMLGIIFSNSLPSVNDSSQNIPVSSGINQKAISDATPSVSWKINLSSNPTSIKPAGDISAAKELNKIDKSTLTVKYDNTSSRDFKNTYMKFVVKSQIRHGIGALPDGNAIPDSKAFPKDSSGTVFDIPDINPNSTNEARVFLFGREKGEISVTAVIVSNDVTIAISDPIIVKVD